MSDCVAHSYHIGDSVEKPFAIFASAWYQRAVRMPIGPSVKGVIMTFHIELAPTFTGTIAGQSASASGDIHSSILEPPKLFEMRPIGTLSAS